MADKLSQREIDAMLGGLEQPAGGEKTPEGKHQQKPVVEKVEFAPFKDNLNAVEGKNRELSYFNHISMDISGELGRTDITVRELLKLEEGSVIKLDKLAGESATILVNGQYLGMAEIVVINERFGLRVTAIGSADQYEAKKEAEQKETGESKPENRERQE